MWLINPFNETLDEHTGSLLERQYSPVAELFNQRFDEADNASDVLLIR